MNRPVANAGQHVAQLEADLGRLAYMERVADVPGALIPGSPEPPQTTARREHGSEVREAALRTVERYHHGMDAGAADTVDSLIRHDDPQESTSRYVAAVGDPAYASAFGKMMADPTHGHLRYSAEEVEAVRNVSQIQAGRAMNIGTDSAGGFALPFQLDPSVMLSSDGALNPVRRLARTVLTTSNQWRGISSAGVTVSYSAEAAVMVDGSPVLAQPVITCRRWTAFVPYSWELGQDWDTLQGELVRLIADGRDVNDSAVFFSGTSSSNQPNGIANGLGASQLLLTGATASLTVSDVWALKESVPPRFASNLTFCAPPAMVDRIYRLVPNAATTEPALFPTRDGALAGRPVEEWTFNSGTTVATGATIALAGDFNAGYVIADRLGLTAVPIPTLFGGTAAVHYPTGESGLAVWGRTGGGVVNAQRAPRTGRAMSAAAGRAEPAVPAPVPVAEGAQRRCGPPAHADRLLQPLQRVDGNQQRP